MGRYTNLLLNRPPSGPERRMAAADPRQSALAASMNVQGPDPLLEFYDNWWDGVTGQGQGSGWFGMNTIPQELVRLGNVYDAADELDLANDQYDAAFFDSNLLPGPGAGVGTIGRVTPKIDDIEILDAARVADDLPGIGHNRGPSMSDIEILDAARVADDLLMDEVLPAGLRRAIGESDLRQNPEKFIKQLRREGLVPDSVTTADAAAEIRRIRELRNERYLATQDSDPLVVAQATRPLRAEQMRQESAVMDAPIAESWASNRADEVRRWARLGPDGAAYADREARLATLEAIAREARKLGWNVGHTSTSKNGRVSSRYIDVPEVGRIRISDHELPMTDQRAFNRAQGRTGNWVGEIVVDDWQSMSLDDYMNALRSGGYVDDVDDIEILNAARVADDMVGPFDDAGKLFEPNMADVLFARSAEMDLPPSQRAQPRAEGLTTPAIDDSIASHMRHNSPETRPNYPRLPEGDNRPYPKGDRVRPLIDRQEEIAEAYAAQLLGERGQPTQFFYHTDPIYRAAIDSGLTPSEARAWLDEFSAAYAATSPRTMTEQNLRNATLAMAKREADIPLTEVLGPGSGGINEHGYPMMIGEGGIHKQLLDDAYGDGINMATNPKPNNFARNLAGDLGGVTVDTHVIRGVLGTLNDITPGAIPINFIRPAWREAYLADPTKINPATWIDDGLASSMVNGSPMQVEYGPFADVVERAAEIAGVSPAEAQSMGWFGLGDRTGLASERKTVANLLNERLDVTAQLLNVTPQEVARLLFNKKIPLLSFLAGSAAAGASLIGGTNEAEASQ